MDETLFLLTAILSLMIRASWEQINRAQKELSKIPGNRACKKIVILTPSTQDPAGKIIRGFTSHLKKYAIFEPEILICDMQSEMGEYNRWIKYAFDENPDILFVIGGYLTRLLHHTIQTRTKKNPPVLCGGNPVEFAEESIATIQTITDATGTTASLAWNSKVLLISKLFPHVKKILIMFRSIDEIMHYELIEKNVIAQALRKYKIDFVMHHAANVEKSCEFTADLMKNIDMVLISRNTQLMNAAGQITKESERYNIPVLSTDPSRINEVFSSIASDVESLIGASCGKQTIKILEDGYKAADVPVQHTCREEVLHINLNKDPFIGFKKIVSLGILKSSFVDIQLK